MNLILNTDSYKASHFAQFPEGTSHMYYYLESRGGEYDNTLFFGLQMWLKKYLSKPITQDNINEAKGFFEGHGVPFNQKGWQYILDRHKGYLPLRINAIAEGIVIPTHQALVTCENTDPECFWLPGYIETALLRAVWYPTTVATISKQVKNVLHQFWQTTSCEPEASIMFKLHDFGARGVSSEESAEIGGAAHLVNFCGSDTVSGVLAANKYYNNGMSGFGIPAMEHSSVTSWGKENESKSYANMLGRFGGKYPFIACVSDSYDIFNACESIWGTALKKQVVESGSFIVVRPDSGNPTDTVMKCLDILTSKFGFNVNSKGFKTMNNVRVIQGDGVCAESIGDILSNMKAAEYSLDNIAFGMGGALLQKCDRDTQKFAYKCSNITINGEDRDVYKAPLEDHSKWSKRGRVQTYKVGNNFVTKNRVFTRDHIPMLHTVWENGVLKKEWSLEEVRMHSNGGLL